MIKIVTIVGARPQFVKAAVVSRAFAEHEHVEEILVHTGQHYDRNMSEIFFEEMQIPHPKYNLGINGLRHGEMTGQMLAGIEKVLVDEKPDMVLVYGDTNSTLAGALAAQKMHIPVAHVEAGLRSFNMKMPEETNRILTDRISEVLFCPTQTAIDNLQKEGYDNLDIAIERTGDVMYDAAMHYHNLSADRASILRTLGLEEGKFVLCTLHRQENTDDKEKFESIIEGIEQINSEMTVVWPQHPRAGKMMQSHGLRTNAKVIEPVGYFDMIQLLSGCNMVLTDSGGLQKEAYFFKKFCITARAETEWVELVNYGYNAVVGSSSKEMVEAFYNFSQCKKPFDEQLYGDGNAGKSIAKYLLEFLSARA